MYEWNAGVVVVYRMQDNDENGVVMDEKMMCAKRRC
jgi:hypothetical protein